MKIAIIGWYGTETIGDRAILAGLLSVMSEAFPSLDVSIGSLHPFFTERTLLEDEDFLEEVSCGRLGAISIFDSLSPHQLKTAIKHADLLAVGGGPLMDIQEMSMLEYAFAKARAYHVKSMLLGCGWGPLTNGNCIQKALRLAELSDHTIFRDDTSAKQCRAHGIDKRIDSAIDPAFFACRHFLQTKSDPRKETYIAINFRDFDAAGSCYGDMSIPDDRFLGLIRDVLEQTELPVHLVPMHYFHIGGDDRVFLQRIADLIQSPRVTVFQDPLSLRQTMEEYYHAKACIGMRFHAIVMQTMLNGNNYILDYTDPSNGKIVGMLRQFQIQDRYRHRYVSLHSQECPLKIETDGPHFRPDEEIVANANRVFLDAFKQL